MKFWFRLFICFIIIIGLYGCIDEQGAFRVLTENGYTNIIITGQDYMMCGSDDMYQTGFTATSPSNHHVEGTVCSAQGKGYTIRFK